MSDRPEPSAPRIVLHAILLAFAVTLSGCFVADTTLTLKPDGSGSISIDYSMDEDAGTQLKGILSIRKPVAVTADPTFKISPSDRWFDILTSPSEKGLQLDLAPCKEAGMLVESVRVTAHEGRREVHILLDFTNLISLTRLDVFPQLGLELHNTTNGTYTIRRMKRDVSPDMTALINDPAYIQQVTSVYSGLTFRVRFVSPTPIVSTSGTKTNVNRAEWLFSFDKNPKDILSLQNDELSATFEGTGLSLPELNTHQR